MLPSHRFPAQIISSVWLYFRFALRVRDVDEMLAMRGVCLSYETIREWRLKFGQTLTPTACAADPLVPVTNGIWMRFSWINGQLHYLWRAVDQDDEVLDILVPKRRDRKAAKKFFRKLLKGLKYVPRVIVTDKLRS